MAGAKKTAKQHVAVQLTVDQPFKGQKSGTVTAEFHDDFGPDDMTSWFKKGSRQVAFVFAGEGGLSITGCGPTLVREKEAKELLKQLPAWAESAAYPREKQKKILDDADQAIKKKQYGPAIDALERLAAAGDARYRRAFLLGLAQARWQNPDAARGYYVEASAEGSPYAVPATYNLACLYAGLGERAQALDYVQATVALIKDEADPAPKAKAFAKLFADDPDLLPLRGDKRFKAQAAALKKLAGER